MKSVLDSLVGSTITDPSSGSRAANQPFFRTNRARKSPYYPVNVIDCFLGNGTLLGKLSSLKYHVMIQITAFAKNQKDPDVMLSQIMAGMQASRTTFDGYGMRRTNPHLSSMGPLIEEEGDIFSKAATYNFVYYAVSS